MNFDTKDFNASYLNNLIVNTTPRFRFCEDVDTDSIQLFKTEDSGTTTLLMSFKSDQTNNGVHAENIYIARNIALEQKIYALKNITANLADENIEIQNQKSRLENSIFSPFNKKRLHNLNCESKKLFMKLRSLNNLIDSFKKESTYLDHQDLRELKHLLNICKLPHSFS